MRHLRLAFPVAALALVAYWSTLQAPISADATSHVETAFSFLLEGNADVDEYVALSAPLRGAPERIGDHWYAPYTSGNAALFAVPALVALAAGIDPTMLAGVSVFPKAVASVFVATSVALVLLALRRLVDARTATYVTMAYALGSNAFAGASQEYGEHPTSLMLGTAGILLVLVGGPRAAAGAGLSQGAALIVRPTNVFLFVALLAVQWRARRVDALRYLLWAIPPLAFQATVSLLTFGSPFRTARGELPFGSLLEGAAGQLISPSRGLFVYAPWTVFAVLALALSWRGPADRPRWLVRFGSLAFAANLVLFGAYADWWGGWTFGNRYLSDLAPLYALALADAWRRGWFDRWWLRALLALAIGWSILLHAVGAGLHYFTWSGRHWDVTPNIDLTPWRLWDWTDTQWQFLLRRLVTDPGPAMVMESAVVLACIAGFALVSLRSTRDGYGRSAG